MDIGLGLAAASSGVLSQAMRSHSIPVSGAAQGATRIAAWPSAVNQAPMAEGAGEAPAMNGANATGTREAGRIALNAAHEKGRHEGALSHSGEVAGLTSG